MTEEIVPRKRRFFKNKGKQKEDNIPIQRGEKWKVIIKIRRKDQFLTKRKDT